MTLNERAEKAVEHKKSGLFKNVLFYVLPVILLIISISTIFSNDIWGDENYSLQLIKLSYVDGIIRTAWDVHPPLYYIILKTIVDLFSGIVPNPIWTAKFVSLIPHIFLLVLGFTIIKNKYGTVTAFLFNMFSLGMPALMGFSTEIRMYSWGMLFVTLAFLSSLEIYKAESEKKYYILLTIFSALASYCHYFACAASIVIYIEIFIYFNIKPDKKGVKRTFLSGLGVAIIYLPWILVFIMQLLIVSGGYWIAPLTPYTIMKNLIYLFDSGDKIVRAGCFLLFVIAIIGILAEIKSRKNIESICGFGVWFGTIFLGVVLSLIIRPIFVSRYIIVTAMCFWFAVAFSINNLKVNWLKVCCVLAAVALSIGATKDFLSTEAYYQNGTNKVLAFLDENLDGARYVITNSTPGKDALSYFYTDEKFIVVDEENSKDVLAIINEDPSNKYILMDTDGTLSSLLPGILDKAEHIEKYNIHWDVLDKYVLSNQR